MPKDHKKNNNIALIGTVIATLVIILFWIRVILPLEQKDNKEKGVPTADIIETLKPESPQQSEIFESNSIITPVETNNEIIQQPL